jgi:threonyl-tRNA synthetase
MLWEDNGTLGTIQVDYNPPERFDLTLGSDNEPHRPVMIHRAPLFNGTIYSYFVRTYSRKFPTVVNARTSHHIVFEREI